MRVGSNTIDTGGIVHKVEKVFIHPNFTSKYEFDVAILKLATALEFNNRAQPVQLAGYLQRLPPVGSLALVMLISIFLFNYFSRDFFQLFFEIRFRKINYMSYSMSLSQHLHFFLLIHNEDIRSIHSWLLVMWESKGTKRSNTTLYLRVVFARTIRERF